MKRTRTAFICAALILLGTQVCSAAAEGDAQFRALYKELVETNTTLSAGSCTLAAERMAARLKAAGFSDTELQVFTAPEHPKEGGLVASIPVAIPSSRRSCCSRTSMWSRPSARTGRAIRSS